MNISLRKLFIKQIYQFSNSNTSNKQSRLIIDPQNYKDKSIVSILINKYKTANSLSDLQKSCKDFTRKTFPLRYVNRYNNEIMKNYLNKDHRSLQQHFSLSLHQEFKTAIKNKEKKLPWQLSPIQNISILQARTHSENLGTFKTVNMWFQLICQFTQVNGNKKIHILQRNSKQKLFIFIKMNLQ